MCVAPVSMVRLGVNQHLLAECWGGRSGWLTTTPRGASSDRRNRLSWVAAGRGLRELRVVSWPDS